MFGEARPLSAAGTWIPCVHLEGAVVVEWSCLLLLGCRCLDGRHHEIGGSALSRHDCQQEANWGQGSRMIALRSEKQLKHWRVDDCAHANVEDNEENAANQLLKSLQAVGQNHHNAQEDETLTRADPLDSKFGSTSLGWLHDLQESHVPQ